MEKDQQLKQILLNSAEGASAGFTAKVMERVNELSEVRNYDPLLQLKLQRIFIFSFGFILICILLLSLFIALTQMDIVSWLKSMKLPEIDYSRILIFIVCFWTVFAFKGMVDKILPAR